MKRAALSILLSFVFISPSFAVLRPVYPIKPTPPYGGQFIIIGDSLRLPPKSAPPTAPR